MKLFRSNSKKAAFLDRDGVINRDNGYVHRWEDFEFLPGAIEGMRRLQEAGFSLVIVTNQAGIARGYYDESRYKNLMQLVCEELKKNRVHLDGVYHCPHHLDGKIPQFVQKCNCRKPKPGMILQAANDLELCLEESILIGDKSSDIEAARSAGIGRAYLVFSNHSESTESHVSADSSFASLLDCVERLFPRGKLP